MRETVHTIPLIPYKDSMTYPFLPITYGFSIA
jgi:hypothetical protein